MCVVCAVCGEFVCWYFWCGVGELVGGIRLFCGVVVYVQSVAMVVVGLKTDGELVARTTCLRDSWLLGSASHAARRVRYLKSGPLSSRSCVLTTSGLSREDVAIFNVRYMDILQYIHQRIFERCHYA